MDSKAIDDQIVRIKARRNRFKNKCEIETRHIEDKLSDIRYIDLSDLDKEALLSVIRNAKERVRVK